MAAIMIATSLATFLIVRPLAAAIPLNVETAPAKAHPHSEETVPAESLLEIGTHRHLQALMANMTVQAALARPPFMPAELQAFVNSRLGGFDEGSAQAFLQARTSKIKMMAKVALQSGSHLGSGEMDADAARAILNKMAFSTMTKLDVQRAECITQQAAQRQLLDETGQDSSNFNAQGTSARARVMATQNAIKRLTEAVPQLNQELSLHGAKCKQSAIALRKQIALVQKDAGTLARLSGLASCEDGFLQTGLLRCSNNTDGQLSFIAFTHTAFRRKAAQLKLPSTRRKLQHALAEVYKQSFVQVLAGHRHHRRGRSHHGKMQRQKLQKHVVSKIERIRSASSLTARHNSTKPSPRCTMRSNPDCNTMRDKLMIMQADVIDEVDGRRSELAANGDDCQAAKKNIQAQITATGLRLMEQQQMLAEATAVMIEAAEQNRLKGTQMDDLEAERKKLNAFCQESVSQAATELCKIKALRQELYKKEKTRPFIQDCEVSSWTPGECSKACGGGVHNLIRQVIVPDDKGASCPPLTMQASCNMQGCPVDCGMGEWSGWTSCSAKCGGGIMQRIRHVKQRSKHGGKLCGGETQSAACGVAACDRDCKLAPWSKWSSCSSACGGGFQERVRRVAISCVGLGSCAAQDSKRRLQYKGCNADKCKPKNAPLLKCASKVDVVLLLDGSGSLGEAGFEAMKKAGASLVKAFDPKAGAQVAVMLYSGPKDMAGYKRCTGAAVAKGARKLNLVTDCKMKWVSHFTTSTEAVASNIEQLYWQKGSTMTSMALANAEAELQNGRSDAETVVIAIADRLPMMPRRTGEAAASLRKKARLIWATAASQSDLQKFSRWASKPAASNIVLMNKIDDIVKPETLNKIIADACPKVE